MRRASKTDLEQAKAELLEAAETMQAAIRQLATAFDRYKAAEVVIHRSITAVAGRGRSEFQLQQLLSRGVERVIGSELVANGMGKVFTDPRFDNRVKGNIVEAAQAKLRKL